MMTRVLIKKTKTFQCASFCYISASLELHNFNTFTKIIEIFKCSFRVLCVYSLLLYQVQTQFCVYVFTEKIEDITKFIKHNNFPFLTVLI